MATIYRADDEASRRAAANLANSLAEFSQPTRPTRPTRPQSVAPAAPVAVRPQVQPPQSSATSIGRNIGDYGARAVDLAGTPLRLQLDAANAAAMYARNVGRGILGRPALDPARLTPNRAQGWLASLRDNRAAPAQPAVASPSRPAAAPPAQTLSTPATTQTPAQAAATQPPAPNQPQSQPQPLRPGDPNTSTYGDGRTVSVNPTSNAAIGSVASQNFGTAPAATVNYGQRPQVASTFGLSANDPRLNDGNQAPQRPQVSLRGADAMSEAYNATADREARQRLASDLDSERFRLGMIAGEGGNRRSRAALEAMGHNAQQRAALASSAEALSANAIQNRANRDNTLANTGLQERGQDFRAQLDAQNRSDIAGMQNATEQQRIAAGITRPMFQGGDGTYYQANNSGGPAAVVTGPDGKPIRGAVGQVAGQITPQSVLSSIDANIKAVMDAGATTGQVDQAALANLTAQRDALIANASGQQANDGAPQTEDAFVQAAVRAGKSEEAARAWWKANRAQGASQ